MKKKFISEYEFAVLRVLWNADELSARSQTLERRAKTGMNPALFHFAMNNLLERGDVDIAGVERCGAGYGRTYAPPKVPPKRRRRIVYSACSMRFSQKGAH